MDIEAIKSALTERDNAITNRLDGITKQLDEHRKWFDAREDDEARANQPGRTCASKHDREHMELFTKWMRSPQDATRNLELSNFEAGALGRKDVTIASPSGGGYAVPEDISRQVGLLQQKFSPVRSLVKVVPVGTSDYKELIDINGVTSGWVSESGSRTATNTSALREVAPTHGELYAYPQASEWSLDDMFFNVEGWLADSLARSFAIAEAEAVIRGNGSNKPKGMLNTTPVTTADNASPKRAAAAYQYILGADGSPAQVDADSLIDLYFAVNSAYRANGTWAMNSATAAQVRKLKDSTNQYIWQPGLVAGQPDLLLGRPVAIWEQLDEPLGGMFPVVFGDFMQGYTLMDRTGLRILRDPYTNPGYVRFYCRKRVGGIPANNDSLKFLKLL